MLRTYAKRDPAASPATHAYAMEALDRNLDRFKQILKKQVIQHLKKLKLGIEFEEICYNIWFLIASSYLKDGILRSNITNVVHDNFPEREK